MSKQLVLLVLLISYLRFQIERAVTNKHPTPYLKAARRNILSQTSSLSAAVTLYGYVDSRSAMPHESIVTLRCRASYKSHVSL